jgi:hypothetical protein
MTGTRAVQLPGKVSLNSPAPPQVPLPLFTLKDVAQVDWEMPGKLKRMIAVISINILMMFSFRFEVNSADAESHFVPNVLRAGLQSFKKIDVTVFSRL